MKVQCACGRWHNVSPTALAIIVQAFQDGDLQLISHEGVYAICFEQAFTNSRVTLFQRLYKDNTITFDNVKWGDFSNATPPGPGLETA